MNLTTAEFESFRLMQFTGVRFIESTYLTEPREQVVQRTWRERLFSRPWRPLIAEKTIFVEVPLRQAFQISNNTVVVHPEFLREIKIALAEKR